MAAVATLEAGISLAEFWNQTPYETQLTLKAYSARQQFAYRVAIWSAWHTEAFHRAKRLPSLDKVMGRLEDKAPKRLSGPEILEAVKAINRAAGGKEVVENG